MRIGIDIDDTICDSLENMLPYICKYYDLNYEEEKAKALPYTFYHNLPNYHDFAINFYDTIMPNARLKDGADYYINKLSELGHDIIFITARNNFGFVDPYKISAEYLDKYGIYYDKLITSAVDKGGICLKENIDIFIDDSLINCDSVENVGIKVFLFDNYFNKKDHYFDRVYSWQEIYNRFLEK